MKTILRTLYISLFVLLSATLYAEKYITTIQPETPEKFKHFGEYFYDMKNINTHPIPNVLERPDGNGKVKTAQEWVQQVRPLVLKYFEDEVYGAIPPRPDTIKFELFESSKNALGGIAERRQYRITVGAKYGERSFHVLLYLPLNANNTPAFICPNFNGNYTITTESEVKKIIAYRSRMKTHQRGSFASRIPVAEIVSRGYAIATFSYEEIYNDGKSQEISKKSVYGIFEENPTPKNAIAMWAWGNMRVMDLLQSLPEIDHRKIGVAGHSRMGKTALLTGAFDTRFAYVIVNNSGCMGDALSKRKYGETIKSMFGINQVGYWFSPALKKYIDNEGAMPLDQHHLIATIAPRMLYTTSATEDVWADPEGQLLGLIHACPIYKLFGAKNFPTLDALEIEKPVHADVAYHIRKGKHDMTSYDWNNFIDYAEKCGWKPQTKQ